MEEGRPGGGDQDRAGRFVSDADLDSLVRLEGDLDLDGDRSSLRKLEDAATRKDADLRLTRSFRA